MKYAFSYAILPIFAQYIKNPFVADTNRPSLWHGGTEDAGPSPKSDKQSQNII